VRARISEILDEDNPSAIARRTRAIEIALILIGIASVSVGTVDSISPSMRTAAAILTGIVAFLSLLEYLVRLWIAPEAPHLSDIGDLKARVRWVVSWEGVIDLLAIVPALSVISGGARLGADSAAIFILLWVLKLATHAHGFGLIGRVVMNERSQITAVLVLFVVTLLSAATLAHFAEGDVQPAQFGSIPASLWWAIVTLTTTGYGDVVPVTAMGRIIGGGLMIAGICVLALLAGILANGFAEEVKRREFVRIWELVTKVPFFADLGAIAISDIVGRLRSRNYPKGAIVLRKGGPADAMYFIVSGEVEIRLPRPVSLRDGAFFGEMALLDRRPRSADAITTSPCTLLLLNVADFYQVAAQHPTLVQTIEAEARRRQAANATVV
jgi:voltage-gated potassium channel